MPTFAAIDIGSNSVRLKISRLQAGRLKEVHEDREVTRLGEGVFSGGPVFAEASAGHVARCRSLPRGPPGCAPHLPEHVAPGAPPALRPTRTLATPRPPPP